MPARPRGERANVPGVPALPNRTLVRRGLPTKHEWAYSLVDPACYIEAPWVELWRPHRKRVDLVLRAIPATFRLRHDPHIGKFARLALKAQIAALATFDSKAPDYGVASFTLAFALFRAEKNALAAAYGQDQPRRAAEIKRLTGDATRNDVKYAWAADVKAGRPARGRIKRVAIKIARPESTVRDAALAQGLIEPRKE